MYDIVLWLGGASAFSVLVIVGFLTIVYFWAFARSRTGTNELTASNRLSAENGLNAGNLSLQDSADMGENTLAEGIRHKYIREASKFDLFLNLPLLYQFVFLQCRVVQSCTAGN